MLAARKARDADEASDASGGDNEERYEFLRAAESQLFGEAHEDFRTLTAAPVGGTSAVRALAYSSSQGLEQQFWTFGWADLAVPVSLLNLGCIQHLLVYLRVF